MAPEMASPHPFRFGTACLLAALIWGAVGAAGPVMAQSRPPGSGQQNGVIDDLAQAQTSPPGGAAAITGQSGQRSPPGGGAVVSQTGSGVRSEAQSGEPGSGAQPTALAPRLAPALAVDLSRVHRGFDLGVPSPGQKRPGVVVYAATDGDVMSVNIGAGLPVSISLPPCEAISRFEPGDMNSFPITRSEKQRNVFYVDATRIGVDTALHVEGNSGATYHFYLRSVPPDSTDMPDVAVRVEDPACPSFEARTAAATGRGAPDPEDGWHGTRPQSIAARRDGAVADGDFMQSWSFDPTMIRTQDIEVLAQDPADAVIAPSAVWHDGVWTWLDFRDQRDGVRLPVPFVVEDGLDHPVGWRMVQPGLMAVETVAPMLALKSGRRYLCLRHKEKGADTPKGLSLVGE